MSTTFAGRLTGSDGRDLRLYLTIDGIADVLQEGAIDVPYTFETSTRPRRRLVQTIEQGQAELDLEQRRMVGGSLRVVLVDDFDSTLAALFASRTRRATYVTGTTTAAATTINVSSTTGLPTSGTIYIGGETITYTSTTATSFTGCTRGAFGSTASRHYGGTDQGAGVFTTPPRWVGRRVRLYGYFINDDGTTTTSLRRQLDTFRLEEAPVYIGQGRWELRCSHLSDEVAQRKLGTGLRKIKARPDEAVDDVGTDYVVWTTEGQTGLFRPTVSGRYPTYVAVTFQDADGIAVLRWREANDATASVTQVKTEAEGDLGSIRRVRRGSVPDELQHWVILRGGDAGSLLLIGLTSVLGDGANGFFDLLPGTDRDTGIGGEELRFGAGVPTAEVDESAILLTGSGVVGWTYLINESISVADFLRDFCLSAEAVWRISRTGQITVQKLSEGTATPTLTVDDDLVIGEPTVELAEDVIYPRARIRCGYDPLEGDFVDSVAVVDVEMAARYPERGDELELETRALCLSRTNVARGIVSYAQLETLVRRAMVDDGRGRLYVSARCLLPALELQLGDVVALDLDLPDYEGATLTGRQARVVALKPDYDGGVVDVRLQVLETLRLISAGAVIASVAGTTITLLTPSLTSYSSSAPGFDFAVGDTIEIVDVSTGTTQTRVVQSVTTTTIVVTVAPTLTTPGNYIRNAPSTTNAGSTNVNTYGESWDDFIYQQPATGIGLVTRWR